MSRLYALAIALFGATVACGAFAQSRSDATDPPVRVARLSYLHGAVSFTPAGESEWVEAQLNRPLVTGDRLWTDAGAHAELELGPARLELDRETSFDFLDLDDQTAQMELTQGALHLDVDRLGPDQTYEIDTPTVAFVVDQPGAYRVDVDPRGGITTVTVWDGGGEAYGEGGRSVELEPNRAVRFADARLQDYQVIAIAPPDPFGRFVDDREGHYADAHPRYVSADMTGYEDLSQYGSWDQSPEYGHVWYPHDVAADWAPYHDGRWVWIDPWGWTWVDDEPWGFAPFHYGRWAYIDARWGWVPGPLDVEPVYAPALVAFVGGGVSIGISLGEPIGWFPLGPRDVYFPGYRCGSDYFTRINIGNAYVTRTVVNDYYGEFARGRVDYAGLRYANRDAPRAIAAMTGSAFVAGDPVSGSALRSGRTRLAHGRILPRATLTPTRASLVAGRRRGHAPPDSAMRRGVIAAHRPPPRRPSFAQRRSHLQREPGRPLDRSQLRALAGGGGQARLARNVRVIGNGRVQARHGGVHARGERVRSARYAHEQRAGHGAARFENARSAGVRGPRTRDAEATAARDHLRSARYAHEAGRGHGAQPGGRSALARHERTVHASAPRPGVERRAAHVGRNTRPERAVVRNAPHAREHGNARRAIAGRERATHAQPARAQRLERAQASRRAADERRQVAHRSALARQAHERAARRSARSAPAPQHRAFAGQRAGPRHAAARHAPVEHRMARAPQRPVQHAPPQRREARAPQPRQVQHAAPPQRREARAAPQPRQAPPAQRPVVAHAQRGPQNRHTASRTQHGRNNNRKDKDKDHPSGG